MSQAEALLNSLVPDETVSYSADPASEPHIVINRDKTVTIPEELKRILVQYEHNIETVTFDCPRYWNGHDLYDMAMRIVFERPDGHKEPHPVENLRVDETDPDMIHFEWTISNNTTLKSGNVRITICAKITNAEGIADREWHTIPNDELYVNEGMDCDGEEIVEQYPDIIDSILVRLDIAEQGGASDEQIAAAVETYMAEHPVVPDSGQNAALTTAQIEALHGMFKVCAFKKDDVSAEYAAFKTAFGIKDSGEEEPDEPHTHSYTSAVTTAATCTTAGVRTYTCSCGESYTESIPATGHNYVDGVCTVCGAADPDYSPESGGDTEDAPMDIDTWDYEWAAENGTSLENSGWEQFTAYTGFQSTFDAATGQKLAIVEPANTSVFGGFTLTNYPTATEAVCEAVVNFDTVEQGEFMMSLTDGTNLAGFRILRNQHYAAGGQRSETIFEAGVDYLLRVEFYTDRFRLYVNGGLEYESTAFWDRSGTYHKWGNSGKTMLCVAPDTDSEITTAANAVNIKSYKYKVVTE